jgi:hypothetical protein
MYWIMKGLTSRVLRAPEDGGSGGSNDGGDGGDDGGNDGAGDDGNDGDDGIGRPEFISEKFWKDDYVATGEGEKQYVDWQKVAEDMAGHHKAAENKIFTRKEDLMKEARSEVEAELNKPVEGFPETPDKYEVSLSKDIIGDNQEFIFDEADPHAQWFRQTAHDMGLSNDRFNELINEYVGIQYANMPDFNEEVEKLGEMGDMRVERAAAWARANFSEDSFKVMENLSVTAEWIKVVEEIMELSGQPKFEVSDGGEMKDALTLADLKAMQNDPKYWKEQDPQFVQKVRQGFAVHAKRTAAGA